MNNYQIGRPVATLSNNKMTLDIPFLPAKLGRNDRAVDLYLFHESVSREHCLFECIDHMYTIRDLGSTAGTFVNGVQLEPNVPYRLDDGSKLRLGKIKLVFNADYEALQMFEAAKADAERREAAAREKARKEAAAPRDRKVTVTARELTDYEYDESEVLFIDCGLAGESRPMSYTTRLKKEELEAAQAAAKAEAETRNAAEEAAAKAAAEKAAAEKAAAEEAARVAAARAAAERAAAEKAAAEEAARVAAEKAAAEEAEEAEEDEDDSVAEGYAALQEAAEDFEEEDGEEYADDDDEEYEEDDEEEEESVSEDVRNTLVMDAAELEKATAEAVPEDDGAARTGSGTLKMSWIDDVSGETKRVVIREFPFFIGRNSEESDYTVRKKGMSRRHFCFEKSGGKFWLRDDNSTNGVRLNGEIIPADENVEIHSGDRIRAAGVTFTIRIDD